jgi:2-polyprenyl-3-methyl-5-hydroxy-6-metoxy-1,4-benzoquinol methylase
MSLSLERIQKIEDHFDSFSEHFLKWSPSVQFQQIFKETVLKIAENTYKSLSEVKVLDVGCGHGTWINFLLKNATNPEILRIKGLDISKERIALARKMLGSDPRVSLEIMDFKKMAGEKYDIIFFAEVFQFIPKNDYYVTFQKMNELLAKGGHCVIIDKERYSFTALKIRIFQILGKIGLASEIYRYISYPSFRSLSKLSKRANLIPIWKGERKEFHGLVLAKG